MTRQSLPRRRRVRALADAVRRWACNGCGKSDNRDDGVRRWTCDDCGKPDNGDDASNCGECGRSW